MTFVVVYLLDAKRVVVVAENWVQDLNNAKLKNIGKNSKQNFLMFWSSTNNEPNHHKEPNFSARLVKEYFSTHIGVCYICRIIKFFDEYDCAMTYAGKIRPGTPPLYNENRLKEKPIPKISQPSNDSGSVLASDDDIESSLDQLRSDESENSIGAMANNEVENSIDPLTNKEIEKSMNQFGSDESENSIDLLANEDVENLMNQFGADENENSIDALANEMIQNSMDEFDTHENENSIVPIAYSTQLNNIDASDQNQVEVNDSLYVQVKQEPEVFLDDVDIAELDALLQYGEVSKESFENIDEDVMIQKLNVYPKPIETQYGIKEDDALCGNIPFKSYANGSRGFPTHIGPELLLNNDAVKMLMKWNVDRSRQSEIIDKIFIEYLMIVLVGTVKIKAEDVGGEAIDLIKDLFTFRVEHDKNRLEKFETIFKNKCKTMQGKMDQSALKSNKKNDRISGDLPFKESTTGSRSYILMGKQVQLKKAQVHQFMIWSTVPFVRDERIDMKLVHQLMTILQPIFGFKEHTLDQEILNFIQSFIAVRASGNDYRIHKVVEYVANYWQKK